MAKILFISHGHPRLIKGGAENAAYQLFLASKENHDCVFLAHSSEKTPAGTILSAIEKDEYLIHTKAQDKFYLSNQNAHELRDLTELLVAYEPEVVHVHHFLYIGIELFTVIRKCLPKTKIVFTLHDFTSICHHGGTMIKTFDNKLCTKESPLECSVCYPKEARSNFFLRKSFIQDHLSKVDLFIASSHFLANKYRQWGLADERLIVMENYISPSDKIAPRPLLANENRARFAFFGQLNPFKGVHVILEALNHIPPEFRDSISVSVYGANLDKQSPNFQKKIKDQLESTKNVHFGGAYETEEMGTLMAECDWVIVPSIWWENSPLVIQEAISIGRPLLGSNVGGTKEKIENIAGLTFLAGNPISLSRKMIEAIQPKCFDYWHQNLPSDDHLSQYNILYDEITLDQESRSLRKNYLTE